MLTLPRGRFYLLSIYLVADVLCGQERVGLPPVENWDYVIPEGHVRKLTGSYLGTTGGRAYFRTLHPEAPANPYADTVIEIEKADAPMQGRLKAKNAQLQGYFAQDTLHWWVTSPETVPAALGQLELDGVRLGMTDAAALAALKTAGYEIAPVRTVFTVASEVKVGVIAAHKKTLEESFTMTLDRRTLQVDAHRYRDSDGALVTDPIRIGRRQYAQEESINVWFLEDVTASVFTTVVTNIHTGRTITGALPAKGTVELKDAFGQKWGAAGRTGSWQRFFGNPAVPQIAGTPGFREVLTPQGSLQAEEFTRRLKEAAREAIAAGIAAAIQNAR